MGFEGSVLDIGLHLVTILVAVTLFVLALRAYRRKPTEKFLFIGIAFGLFAVKEALITGDLLFTLFSGVPAIAHSLNLGILIAFFYGVIK